MRNTAIAQNATAMHFNLTPNKSKFTALISDTEKSLDKDMHYELFSSFSSHFYIISAVQYL